MRAVAAVAVALAVSGAAFGSAGFQGPWLAAAAKLNMAVLAPPSAPLGLKLISVKPEKLGTCGATKEQLTAVYRSAGKEVFFIEGKPRVCGDVGDADEIGRPVIHGSRGALFDFGPGAYLLLFSRFGVQIGIQTKGVTKAQLIAIANSLRAVPG